MGFMENMMNGMMGKMKPEEKSEMMNGMMDNFFSTMSGEDRQKMMSEMIDKFMASMSQEEKQSMMSGMMPKMMSSMSGGGSPMGGMMNMMMGERKSGGASGDESPFDMCRKMMSGMTKTAELATMATPEVMQLFEEWVRQIDEEILNYVRGADRIDAKDVAAHFKLTEESANYFLTRLARNGKIKFSKDDAKA